MISYLISGIGFVFIPCRLPANHSVFNLMSKRGQGIDPLSQETITSGLFSPSTLCLPLTSSHLLCVPSPGTACAQRPLRPVMRNPGVNDYLLWASPQIRRARSGSPQPVPMHSGLAGCGQVYRLLHRHTNRLLRCEAPVLIVGKSP